jgi:DNA polymerase-3 subunit delta
MAQQTLEAFYRSLKIGEFAPVYYFYGPEDVLKDEAARAALDYALDPSLRDFNYDQRTVAQLDPESLHALLNTLPMMAERRVVVLRDLEGLKRKARVKAGLEGYLEHPSPDTMLVLIQGSADTKPDPVLARRSTSIEFLPLSPELVVRWIAHRARQQRLTLTAEAASHLLEAVGNDLGTLGMEVDKLAGLAGETAIGIDQVAALVGVRRGETLVSWRDKVMQGDAASALSMLGGVLEQSGMSGIKMVSALGTALTGMGLTSSFHERGLKDRALQQKVMSTLLRIRPYGLPDWKSEAEKWSRWSPLWPADRVRKALRAVLDADRALKNARISDERGVVTDLVLRMTEHRWGQAA